jgi:hypothetical protein
MKLDRRPDGSLVVRENPAVLRGVLICLGAAVLVAVALQEARDELRLWLGALGSLVPLAGAALLERVHFEFDVAQRRLRWRRRNLFRTLSGELPFGEISDVELRVRQERDLDVSRRRTTPTWCVALRTSAGDLRLSDRRYADERETSEIADAIRAVLGVRPGAPVGDGVERRMAQSPTRPWARRASLGLRKRGSDHP